MKRIVQISPGLQQGFAEPVLCRAEDGTWYVAKGRWSGRDTMVREWIAGRIGSDFGLPIPEVELLTLGAAEAVDMIHPNAMDLAAMPSFGSSFVENVMHLPVTSAGDVPQDLRALVLLFDWWVLNGDRTDGNVNLLWSPHVRRLHVIDHNLAFGEHNLADFWHYHVFRDDRVAWDASFRAETGRLMRDILGRVPQYWEELPVEWIDPPCDTSPELVDKLLRRIEDPDAFWPVP